MSNRHRIFMVKICISRIRKKVIYLTRQREAFLVLMENMDKVNELTKISRESAGSAEQKYGAYMNSIEAGLKRIQNAWQELTLKFTESDGVIGKTIHGIMDGIAYTIENLPRIIGMIVQFLEAKYVRQFMNTILNNNFGDTVSRLFGLGGKPTDANGNPISRWDMLRDKADKKLSSWEQHREEIPEGIKAIRAKLDEMLTALNKSEATETSANAISDTAIAGTIIKNGKTYNVVKNDKGEWQYFKSGTIGETKHGEKVSDEDLKSFKESQTYDYKLNGSEQKAVLVRGEWYDVRSQNNGKALTEEQIKEAGLTKALEKNTKVTAEQNETNEADKKEETKQDKKEKAEEKKKEEKENKQQEEDRKATEKLTDKIEDNTNITQKDTTVIEDNTKSNEQPTQGQDSIPQNGTPINQSKKQGEMTNGKRFASGVAVGITQATTAGFAAGLNAKAQDGELASDEAARDAGLAVGGATLVHGIGAAALNFIPYVGPALSMIAQSLTPMLTSWLDKNLTPLIVEFVDAEKLRIQRESKQAQENLTVLTTISQNTKDLVNLAKQDSLSYQDYQDALAWTQNIRDQFSGNFEVAKQFASNYYAASGRTPSNGFATSQDIDAILDEYLNATSSDARTKIALNINKALQQSIYDNTEKSLNYDIYQAQNTIADYDTKIGKIKNKKGQNAKDALTEILNQEWADGKIVWDSSNKQLQFAESDASARLETMERLMSAISNNSNFNNTDKIYTQLQSSIQALSKSIDTLSDSVDTMRESEVNLAYANLGLSEISPANLKARGYKQIVQDMARQIDENGGWQYNTNTKIKLGRTNENGELVYNYNDLNSEAVRTIQSMLKKIDPNMWATITGSNYTLGEVLDGALDNDLETKGKYLLDFSRTLNISIDDLLAHKEAYKDFVVTEIQDTNYLKTSITTLSNAFEKLASSASISQDVMETITKDFPQLAKYASDPATLVEKMINTIFTDIDLLKQSKISDLFTDSTVFAETQKSIDNYMRELNEDTQLAYNDLFGNATTAESWIETYFLISDEDKKQFGTSLDDILEIIKKDFDNLDLNLTEELKTISDSYLKYQSHLAEEQINNLTAQKEALSDINNQREYEIKLLEAREKLENAQNTRHRVYREGMGFIYEADQEAVQQAQEELDALDTEKKVSALEKQIEQLQYEKDFIEKLPERQQWDALKTATESIRDSLGLKENKGIWGAINDFSTKFSTYTTNKTDSEKFVSGIASTTERARSGALYGSDSNGNIYSGSGGSVSTLSGKDLYASNNTGDLEKLGWELDGDGNYKEGKGYTKGIYAHQAYVTSMHNAVQKAADNLKTDSNEESQTAYIEAVERYNQAIKDASSFVQNSGSYLTDEQKEWGQNIIGESIIGKARPMSAEDRKFYKNELFTAIVNAFQNGSIAHGSIQTTQYSTGASKLGAEYDWMDNDFSKYALSDYFHGVGANANLWGGKDSKAQEEIEKIVETIIGENYSYDTVKLHKYTDELMNKQLISDSKAYDNERYVGLSPSFWVGDSKSTRIGPIAEYVDQLLDNYDEWGNIIDERYALGSLSTKGGMSSISEFGTELFATPSLSGTALIPEGSKVIPAQATRGLWRLGSLADQYIQPLQSMIQNHITNGGAITTTDDSTNIQTLNLTISADKDFDIDTFVQQLKMAHAISKHNN